MRAANYGRCRRWLQSNRS